MIHFEEWLAEIERLGRESKGEGATVRELAQATGKSEKLVREYLAKAKAAGRLVIGVAKRENLLGRMVTSPVYTVKPAKRSNAKNR
jgi:hypothetical protein